MNIMSNDMLLGAPFNIASYATLAMMIALVTGHAYGDLVYTIGDMHVYSNHIEQVKKYLELPKFELPTLLIDAKDFTDVADFMPENFNLMNYQHGPFLEGQIAV